MWLILRKEDPRRRFALATRENSPSENCLCEVSFKVEKFSWLEPFIDAYFKFSSSSNPLTVKKKQQPLLQAHFLEFSVRVLRSDETSPPNCFLYWTTFANFLCYLVANLTTFAFSFVLTFSLSNQNKIKKDGRWVIAENGLTLKRFKKEWNLVYRCF